MQKKSDETRASKMDSIFHGSLNKLPSSYNERIWIAITKLITARLRKEKMEKGVVFNPDDMTITVDDLTYYLVFGKQSIIDTPTPWIDTSYSQFNGINNPVSRWKVKEIFEVIERSLWREFNYADGRRVHRLDGEDCWFYSDDLSFKMENTLFVLRLLSYIPKK